MKPIGDFESERKTLLDKATNLIRGVSELVVGVERVDDLPEAVRILRGLREVCYENLNIIQHDAMILRAADWIKSKYYPRRDVEWCWNPRQTSKKGEADLHGKVAGKIVVSAEITTSKNAKGGIGKKMTQTLRKLNDVKYPGRRVYFVQTEDMRRSAEAEVKEEGYEIDVEIL